MPVTKRESVSNIALVLYRPGDKVPYHGRYAVVDSEGNPMAHDLISLQGGDTFPPLSQVTPRHLFYLLHDDDSDTAFSSGSGRYEIHHEFFTHLD